MSAFEYLLLMGACVLITLPLELFFRARVYRRWRTVLWALVPVIVGVFVSLGFLFAGLFRATSAADAVAEIGNIVAAVL